MKSTELKYIEQIRDLMHKPSFRQTVLDYRKKLGIPPNGFSSVKKKRAFISGGKVDLFAVSFETERYLRRKYKNDKNLLSQVLQWHDIWLEGPEVRRILKKAQLPLRAAYPLHFFILHTPSYVKDLDQKLHKRGDLRNYGCNLFCGYIESDGKLISDPLVKKVSQEKGYPTYEDMVALICIYPEAKRSDVVRLINERWKEEIEPLQSAQAKLSRIQIANVRKKLFRDKYAKLWQLRKAGYPPHLIAEKLGMNDPKGKSYVRKVLSIAKKREG